MVISSDKPVICIWLKVYQNYHSHGSLGAFEFKDILKTKEDHKKSRISVI
jgi:hypothetical protein